MASARALFLELGVRDVTASRAFYAALGFAIDERFTSDRTTCLVLNELGWVMLVERPPDPRARARLKVSAATPQEADDLAVRAAALGGRLDPPSRCFAGEGARARAFLDLDGHRWELMWLPESRTDEPAPPSTPTHEAA